MLKKYSTYLLLLLGVVLVFFPFTFVVPEVYSKIIGLVLLMLALYFLSSKLGSQKPPNDSNLNL